MRPKEKRWLKLSFSFHRCSTSSVSGRGHCPPPLRGGGQWPGTGPFSTSLLWQWLTSARLNGGSVCRGRGQESACGRMSFYLVEAVSCTPTHSLSLTCTNTHTHTLPLALFWPSADLSRIWFTCPQGSSSSCCQLISPRPTIVPLCLRSGWKNQPLFTPVCTN